MKIKDLISQDYRDQLFLVHSSSRWGNAGSSHAQEIFEFADELGAGSILDYGCGCGSLKRKMEIPVIEFDPGILGKDLLPTPCDLLVATDVLEHIEPDRIDVTLSYMRVLALKGAFFIISLSRAGLTLPNGQNAHLSIHDGLWWIDKLQEAKFVIKKTEIRKGLFVWAI